jgi:CubicO group peptidase (beta-lactamase class C family)
MFAFAKMICTAAILMLSANLRGAQRAGPETSTAHDIDVIPDAFMTRWLVCGPFPVLEGQQKAEETLLRQAFDRDFLAEHGGESGIQPTVGMMHGPCRWQLVSATRDIVDLAKLCGPKGFAVAYLWAEIEVPTETKGLLGVGSDDAVKLWLNRHLLHENWTFRGLLKDQDIVPVTFQRGKNQLLAKIQNGTSSWEFCCRLLGPTAMKDALLSATGKGDKDAVKALLENRADVHGRDAQGHTPLHKAVRSGSKEAVELLLAAQADINARTADGVTPLYLAKRTGHNSAAELLLACGADPAIQPADKSVQVDAVFLDWARGETPGAAVAVIQDGKMVHKKGYGLANLEQGAPCTPQTKFRIVSLTKAFTAMAVMILHERGLLNIDNAVCKYLPDYPKGDKITIRQLLTHTSGVQEPVPTGEMFALLPKMSLSLEKRYVMCRDEPLEFNPGERWSYTNAGYIVLGYLIEKVSGQTYEMFLQENIFKPLGMSNTGYDHPGAVLQHRAAGYSREGGTVKNATYFDMSIFGPSGALYSTIEDMTLWDQALYGDTLVKAELLRQAFTGAKLNDGTTADYGFGWVLGKNRGLDEIRATGMAPGFMAQIVRIPAQRFSVIILSNCDALDALDLAHEIAEIYLWEIMTPREP